MSKTKEIEVWVHRVVADGGVHDNGSRITPRYMDKPDNYLPAKLIIDLPEKKVTITESEFEKIVRGMNEQRFSGTDGVYLSKEILKSKLFPESKGGV